MNMYLFANEEETKFFINNHFGLGLHRIEVNSVSDVLVKYKICKGLALLDYHWLTGGYSVPLRVTGEPKTEPFKFDFLKNVSYAEITKQILDTLDFTAQLVLINKLTQSEVCDVLNCGVDEKLIEQKFLWANHKNILSVFINKTDRSMCYQVIDNSALTTTLS